MLKIRSKQTKNKKIKMEQKNKLSSAIKLRSLHNKQKKGIISIYLLQNSISCEKTIAGILMGLKKYTKKLGIVFLHPIQIKTTTKKGEKRLGKGKGTVTTYNRSVPIRAGHALFELGYINQLSSRKTIKLMALLKALIAKLPVRVKIKINDPYANILYTSNDSIFLS